MWYMDTAEKIRIIQQVSGMTQTEIAAKIGRSFVALNNILNQETQPRQATVDAINDLYESLTGTKKIPTRELEARKQVVMAKARKYKNILEIITSNQSVFDQIILELTYHTNGLEGSSLSEGDTAAILFENASIPSKPLAEQLEAKNHQTAALYLFDYLQKSKTITEDLILKMHAILLNSVHPDAGFYRRYGVRIVGANVPTANYLKVPELMRELVVDINRKKSDIIAQAAAIHARFEQIHPFMDGNGRIGRLILQAMLLKHNLPPAVIQKEKKLFYLKNLNKAQIDGDYSLLEDFLCDAIDLGFEIME